MLRRLRRVTEVAPDLFFVRGHGANWVILRGGDLTLIDTGYPADRGLLEQSIRYIGRRPDQVRHILATHNHSDHIGNAKGLQTDYFSKVHATAEEAPYMRRQLLSQISLRTAGPILRSPRGIAWSVFAVASGGLGNVGVSTIELIDTDARLDFPGRPIALLTPGHTPGHTSFYLPEAKTMVVGDAFATAHPTTSQRGPHLLADPFHESPDLARESLRHLDDYDIEIALPGHGPAHFGPLHNINTNG